MTLPRKITAEQSHDLHDITSTRLIERRAQASHPEPRLMQRAGLATARLALALAPHAERIWIACGPGNNGGDGFEAALALHRLGKAVTLTWTGHSLTDAKQPEDARRARLRAEAGGLQISAQPPTQFDLAIDALWGIGGASKPDNANSALIAAWLEQMNEAAQKYAPTLCIDVPSGLDADSGVMRRLHGNLSAAPRPRKALNLRYTLSLLTLKPGLFTAEGRDEAGQVWLDDLGFTAPSDVLPCALLQGQDTLRATRHRGPHASHKGSYGDVAVLGGETLAGHQNEDRLGANASPSSMAGAALLAARAALHAGAGRVYVALVGASGPLNDPLQPELMFRAPEALDFAQQVLVCGCGGGKSIRKYLRAVLSGAKKLVLDADALNAIAEDSALQTLLAARASIGCSTVLTPHPLEAARLLKLSVDEVQADRRGTAKALADQWHCVVLLKGSGSVIAAPGQTPVINHSGNAWLGTAGTGDVLAGAVGAALARGLDAWTATRQSCFQHGQIADGWTDPKSSLTASRLAEQLRP